MTLAGQEQTQRKLFLKTVSTAPGASSDALSCWADLDFQ